MNLTSRLSKRPKLHLAEIRQRSDSRLHARPRDVRDGLGDRFVGGLVLNTGSQAQHVGDRIWVAPIDELWVSN
jgi:hypothetical protein